METITIDVQESTASLSDLLPLVSAGKEIVLTAGATPMARVSPIDATKWSRQPDLHPGAITISDDFDDPLPDEFWLGKE